MKTRRSKLMGGSAAVVLLATTFVSGWEGVRTIAYRDSIGVPTICVGETKGVRMGDRYTREQCLEMFGDRLDEFAAKVERCVTAPMPPKVAVAFTSLAYNIGEGGFCRSSVARLWNGGQRKEACEAMERYSRAGGRSLPGLVRRRAAETELCLEAA